MTTFSFKKELEMVGCRSLQYSELLQTLKDTIPHKNSILEQSRQTILSMLEKENLPSEIVPMLKDYIDLQESGLTAFALESLVQTLEHIYTQK